MAGGRKERTPDSGRLPVSRAFKLYIKGGFVPAAGGRTLTFENERGRPVARYAHASRKDFRDAVVAARGAFGPWSARTAFNRGQILYRLAEVVEGRRGALEADLEQAAGRAGAAAGAEVSVAVDRIFEYAGWADKFAQVLGGVNPVAAPFFNVTIPEPVGVVAVFPSLRSPLVGLVSALAPVILSGNTAVVVVEGPAPTLAVDLAEAVAVSDVPPGVVNLLTGPRDEILPHAASHRDVDAVAWFGGTPDQIRDLEAAAAESVKRVRLFEDPGAGAWRGDTGASLYWISPFVEWKTAWHPSGV